MQYGGKNYECYNRKGYGNDLQNGIYLTVNEQKTFGHNIKNVLKDRKISQNELGSRIGMNRTTLGNKLIGYNVIRKYEADAIINALGITKEEAFKPIPEETISVVYNSKTCLPALNSNMVTELEFELNLKTQALKENLIDLANRLCKKEDLSVQEIEALTSLVQAITRL